MSDIGILARGRYLPLAAFAKYGVRACLIFPLTSSLCQVEPFPYHRQVAMLVVYTADSIRWPAPL